MLLKILTKIKTIYHWHVTWWLKITPYYLVAYVLFSPFWSDVSGEVFSKFHPNLLSTRSVTRPQSAIAHLWDQLWTNEHINLNHLTLTIVIILSHWQLSYCLLNNSQAVWSSQLWTNRTSASSADRIQSYANFHCRHQSFIYLLLHNTV